MILGNLFLALAALSKAVFGLIWWVLVARIVMSWIRPNPRQPLLRSIIGAIYAVTEPVLSAARQRLPFLVVSGIDLSPIVLFLALGFVDQFVTGTLVSLGHAM